ncbi:MAG: GNAT family N-acetyltransferase [Niameybacter sp.]|uniref:GNAT family N-acetyltransferase n=1 Tax=Niameybacter sp. TaxID=2033640 RepID=UPI002FC64160
MRFERLTKAHLDQVAAIYMRAFNAPPWNDQWTVETATKRLSSMMSHEASYGLVAYEKEQLVGMILGYEEQFYDGLKFEIKEFCTDPAVSGGGLGTQLLNEFEEHLKHKGIDEIVLLTCRAEDTQGYYTRRQYKEIQEMVLMGKKIQK